LGRGDELFTNSIVALNADTGEYMWHYQVTPDDAWNFEATMPIMIADLPLQGGLRHVVMEAPKNGFFYVLDARTGALISAEKYLPINWASHVDMKTGRPVQLPMAKYYANASGTAIVRPTISGAHDWRPMSYSPLTGLVYLPVNESATRLSLSGAAGLIGGKLDFTEVGPSSGSLIAWDPVRQRERWKQSLETPGNGGVLSTAGNLVFHGTATGELHAYRTDNGKRLWSMAVNSPIAGTPITVDVEGRQTIFVYTGEEVAGPVRLLAFRLGGTARLPPSKPASPFPKPPLPRPERTLSNRGRALFAERGCEICHGTDAQMVGADPSMPDLRRASAETHQMLAAIVIGGLRRDKGMPVFARTVSPEDLAAIQAFIIQQAWDVYTEQEAPAKAMH
jgi:quinohemoprotein ethanol dehydrogenase